MIAPSAVLLVSVGDCDVAAETLSSTNVLARPKSRILGFPSGPILMFAGFKSLWMIPFSCAASTPSAIWMKSGIASSTGMEPRAIRSTKVSPSTNSMTRNCWPSCSSSPCSVAMFE